MTAFDNIKELYLLEKRWYGIAPDRGYVLIGETEIIHVIDMSPIGADEHCLFTQIWADDYGTEQTGKSLITDDPLKAAEFVKDIILRKIGAVE